VRLEISKDNVSGTGVLQHSIKRISTVFIRHVKIHRKRLKMQSSREIRRDQVKLEQYAVTWRILHHKSGRIMRNRSAALLPILVLLAALVGTAQAGESRNLYRNKDYAFSILFPTGWQQRAGQTPSTVVVSQNREGDSIIIQVKILPQNVTLDSFSDAELKAVISDSYIALKHRFKDIKMHNSGITHICNKKAIWMLYSYSIKVPFSTSKVTTMYYQVWNEGHQYGILCSSAAGRYSHVSGTFLNSVQSFLFEDLSWY